MLLNIVSTYYNFRRKGRPVPFPLPEIETVQGVTEAIAMICKAVSDGVLTPEEALDYSQILDAQRKAIETSEFAARIDKLEAEAGSNE